MSTLKARLKTKLLMRVWVLYGFEKSRWLPSMSPGPAAPKSGSPGAVGWDAPWPERYWRAPKP